MADARQIVDALVRSRKGGIAATAALGGLALVAGLALRALRPSAASETPDLSQVGEDEARVMLRAMVAATLADGIVDQQERRRLDAAVEAAGIDRDGRAWLEKELTDPAEIDELAERVESPEQGARLYAAARLAIDADTLQEREFLKRLAEALDVPQDVAARVDAGLEAA
ncbi:MULTISPECIES: DUF533 domain-containing protein [unclassified Methylobacterium]|uniref:DUF533 domain-containing protein n=1 Tax=unclassified Methylobacterium TaxID=2615210 RepID=UPI00035FFD2C|nr:MULTISPECIES: DUF533 domain-containing protein [unclassified Methylobacterium]KQP38717.1 hypothetical protein ASF34_16060 [Methylobacterium sp. Leaf106]